MRLNAPSVGALARGGLPLRYYLRGLPTFVGNFTSLLRSRPDLRAPLFAFVLPTFRCNCRCADCHAQCASTGDELSTAELIALAEQIGRSAIWMVILSGGDPLVRGDLFRFAEILKRHGKVVALSTNGILVEEQLEEVLEHIDLLEVTFESPLPEIHDRIKGCDGAFERAIRGIELIRARRRGRLPAIGIRGTLNLLRRDEVRGFVERFAPLSDTGLCFRPARADFSLGGRLPGAAVAETEDEVRRLFDGLAREYPFLRNEYYRAMPDFLFRPERMLDDGSFRCLFFSAFTISVRPDGEVDLCLRREGARLGNVKDRDLIEIWRSRRTFEVQQARRTGADCICWFPKCARINQLMSECYEAAGWPRGRVRR